MLGDAVVEEPVAGPSQPPPQPQPPPPTPPDHNGDEPGLIDEMIARMQRAQDERDAAQRGQRLQPQRRRDSAAEGPLSPSGRGPDGPLSPSARGPRRSGNVEGVRQSSGNVPVSHRANANDLFALSRRVIVKALDTEIVK